MLKHSHFQSLKKSLAALKLIPAEAKDELFMAQVSSFEHDQTNFHLWWLGQSGYLLMWRGKRILLDPYLSDSLTKKYANTDKPHVRMSERVVDPGLLTHILAISSSHNHTDHLDAETLIPIIKNNPGLHLVIPEANRSFVAERIQMPAAFPLGLNDGSSIAIDGFTFHGVPAAHNELERDENNNCRYMGYVIEFGNWKVYHSGDTLWYKGMPELLRPMKIDVAILPINGNDPARKVAGNLSAREAAQLAQSIHTAVVIPCHYHMFSFNTAEPEEFAREASAIGQPFCILKPGGHWSSKSLPV